MENISSKEKIFYELAHQEELQQNIIAKIFAYNPDIDISDRTEFVENVKSYYQRFKDEEPEIEEPRESDVEADLSEWRGKDLRIKDLEFHSVKGFPPSTPPFKAKLSSNGQPESTVILGANASGKSSLFEIMEYAYCSKIGEVELRGFEEGNDDRYKIYLENFSKGTENIYARLNTVDKTFSIQNENNIPKEIRNKINPDTHFISDFDLYDKGQLDYRSSDNNSFHNEIAKNLGLSDLLEFDKNLKSFINYNRRVESNRIKEAARNINKQKKFISSNKEEIEEKKEQINRLKEEEIDTEESSEKESVREIFETVKNNSQDISFDYSSFEERKNRFLSIYGDFKSTNRKSLKKEELNFLRSGLDQIENFNDCPFCRNSRKEVQGIIEEVNTRIEKIEEGYEIERKLEESFDEVLNQLEGSISKLHSQIIKINNETIEISNLSEFNDLFEYQSEFESDIHDLIPEEIIQTVTNLEDNREYLSDKYGFIAKFLYEEPDLTNRFQKLDNFFEDFYRGKKEILEQIHSTHLEDSDSLSAKEKIAKLEAEIEKISSQIENAEQNLEKNEEKHNKFQEKKEIYEEIYSETEEYQEVFSYIINKKVNESFKLIQDVVEDVIQDYFEMQNRDAKLVIDKSPDEVDAETGEVLSEIIIAYVSENGNNDSRIPVSKYFNTFHYRLFSTMISISIAIASRKITGINIPLVLDDIFYASDFENRSSIEVFLKALFISFRKYSDGDMPLQLILFTHDEILFESAERVINEIDFLEEENLIFTKLIPTKISKIEGGYKNILYRFSENYKRKIIEKEYSIS